MRSINLDLIYGLPKQNTESFARTLRTLIELSPDREPTRSLLARWSSHHALGAVAADLLAELNRRIDDPDFRIPSKYNERGERLYSIDELDDNFEPLHPFADIPGKNPRAAAPKSG